MEPLTEQERRFLDKNGQTVEKIVKHNCSIIQHNPSLAEVELGERIIEKLLPPGARHGKHIILRKEKP